MFWLMHPRIVSAAEIWRGLDYLLRCQFSYQNLREDPMLPWEDPIWSEMGYLGLRFFQQHLCR